MRRCSGSSSAWSSSARSLPEAIEIIRTGKRASAANLLITDAKVPDAVVVEITSKNVAVGEITSKNVAVRKATSGIIYAANHFVSPQMREPIKDPNSFARYQRVGELLRANEGRVDLAKSIAFLRDRFDARTRRESLSGDVIAW